MNTLMSLLSPITEQWWFFVVHATWQSTLLALLLLLAALALRRRSARLCYGLLLVALLKFAVPPMLALPTGLFSWTPIAPIETPPPASHMLHPPLPLIRPAAAEPPAPNTPKTVATVPAVVDMDTSSSVEIVPALTKSARVDWRTALLLVHLLGILAVAVWMAYSWIGLQALLRWCRPPDDPSLQRLYAHVRERLQLRRHVRLLLAPGNVPPMGFGILRPTVVLSEDLLRGLSQDDLTIVLAHELAHHRRHDPWWVLVEDLLLMAWWFNPVLWVLIRELRRTREDCCDDMVLTSGFTDNERYADCLLNAASNVAPPRPAHVAFGFADRLHPMGRRLCRIMDTTLHRAPRLSFAGLLMLLLLAFVALPGLRVTGAEKETGPEFPTGFEYLWPQMEPGPYRLYGTVTRPDGAPAAGVKVAAFRGEAWQWGYVESVSANDGAYAFEGLPDGAYLVLALDDGLFAAGVATQGAPWQEDNDQRADLTLAPFAGEPIRGRVLSEQGTPVADARVLSIAGWSSYGQSLILDIRTDEDGRFAIPQWQWPYGKEVRPLMGTTLIAVAEDHGPGVLKGELSATELNDITLEKGVRVAGTVRHKDTGKAAVGIPVMLRGTPANDDLPDIVVTTVGEGRFAFERLCPFQYQLVIYDPESGYTANEHPLIRLFDRVDKTDLEFTLSEGAAITGTVTASGEPIEGVRLWIPNVRPPRLLREAVTDAEGRFALRHLPGGEYTVQCDYPETAIREYVDPALGDPEQPQNRTIKKIAVATDETVTADFSFDRGGCVAGRIEDGDGNPISGAQVRATSGGGGHFFSTAELETGSDGAYTLCGLSQGRVYRMMVGAPGFARAEAEVTAATGKKDFVLQKAAAISGRVVDAKGRFVPTVAIFVRPAGERPGNDTAQAYSDDEGYFTLRDGVPPGSYDVELQTLNMGFGPYRRGMAANSPLVVEGRDDMTIEFILPDAESPEAAQAATTTPAQAQRAESDALLTIRAFIDGADMIKVRGSEIWYEHLLWDFPGQWLDHVNKVQHKEPTLVNGVEWRPLWVEKTSMRFTIPGFNLPLEEDNGFVLDKIDVRGGAAIIDTPTAKNDFTLLLKVDDGGRGGAAWYEFAVRRGTPEAAPLPTEQTVVSPVSLEGEVVFRGNYLHRSRGSDVDVPSELLLRRAQDGSLTAEAYLPFTNSTDIAMGDATHQLKRYVSTSEGGEGRPAYTVALTFEDGKVLLTRRGVRSDENGKALPVPSGALFDPNSRPDSYCAANILLRGFNVAEGESKEFEVFDWDNAGEGLAAYRIRLEHKGKESVTVPAGIFDTNHLVLTQVTSANTWFKKQTGHVTDFWVRDDGIIVRVLRHREPYEIRLSAEGDDFQKATPPAPVEQTTPTETPKAPDTTVEGRVADVDGNPIEGARVSIKKWESGPSHFAETLTGPDGKFRLSALPSNSRLFVFADGYASMFRTHDVAEGVNPGWDFALPRSAHVSGRIVDTKGNPAPNRVIELWTVDSGPPPAPGISFYASGGEGQDAADENGAFNMSSVAPGKHRVIVYLRSPLGGDRSMQQLPLQGRFLDVQSGDRVDNFEIVVNPPEDFTLSGHVRNAAGEPMPGVNVDTFIPHGRHWWTRTDENGAYHLAGLDGMGRTSFLLHFNDVAGSGSYKLGIHEVPLNATNVDLVVPDTGSIAGAVRDAKTGEIVKSFEVSVPVIHLPDSGAIWEEPPAQVKRGDDGTFTLSNVPAGEVTVEVRATGLGAQRFTLPIQPNATTPLDCAMKGPAVFAGRTLMNGEPKKTTIVIDGEWLESDDAGNFSFDNYPNGKLLAWIFVHDGWHRTIEVDLKSGETAQMDIETGGTGEIRGKVLFPDDEEDFCTIRLAAKPSPDGWQESGRPYVEEYVLSYSHVRESGGEYTLRGIPPGHWYLMAGAYRPSMHRAILAESHEIDVKEGETLTIDFDLMP